MTRKEMIQVLQEGGSVLYQGSVITRYEDLPTEAELAKGDAAAEAAAKNSLQAEIERLKAQLTYLDGDKPAAKKVEETAKEAPAEKVAEKVAEKAAEEPKAKK